MRYTLFGAALIVDRTTATQQSKVSSPVPAPITPIEPPIRAELRLQTVCLSVLTVVAVGFALWWLQPVAIPFVVAAFLAIALMPLVDWLEKWISLPRTVAACAALVLALLALFSLGALASTAVIQITSSAGQYQTQVEEFITSASKWPPFQWMGLKSLETEIAPENNGAKDQPDAANPPQTPQAKTGGPAMPPTDAAKAAAGNKPPVEVP